LTLPEHQGFIPLKFSALKEPFKRKIKERVPPENVLVPGEKNSFERKQNQKKSSWFSFWKNFSENSTRTPKVYV